jgi:hypothetical protein
MRRCRFQRVKLSRYMFPKIVRQTLAPHQRSNALNAALANGRIKLFQ